jgi:dienelactone hydrolase
MLRRFAFLILLSAAGCAQDAMVLTPAPPEVPASGVIAFHTAGSLARGAGGIFAPGPPQAISGELQFPQGAGAFPAVVLAHGCNGNAAMERSWGATLRAWGYATFILDSFRGRGILEVCTNGRTLTPLQRVPDAYGALRLLATNPKIDPQRVVLMGFSHGGALTMLAATQWAKDTYAPAGQPAFRAFLPFYPNCNASFPERNKVSAPVRIHTGEADDWTPARPCAELAAALKASGQDVEISVYPGAHHAFDVPGLPVMSRPDVNNTSGCFPQMASILSPPSGGAAAASCLKRGATIGGNAEAAAAARSNVRAQLGILLK